MKQYFYLDHYNTHVGPFSEEQIKEFLQKGTINKTTFLRTEESEHLRRLSDFPEFRESLQELRSRNLGGCLGCFGFIALFFIFIAGQKLYDYVSYNVDESHRTKIEISESEFGENWPLLVTHGVIYKKELEGNRQVVIFVSPDKEEYGLNGTAQTMGYRDIHDITKYELYPDGSRNYRDVSALISIGLQNRK